MAMPSALRRRAGREMPRARAIRAPLIASRAYGKNPCQPLPWPAHHTSCEGGNSSAPRDWLGDHAARADIDESALATIRAWLAEQLIADEYAKLGQAGHAETRVPLRRVFIDLPISEHPTAEADAGFERSLLVKWLHSTKPFPLRNVCGSLEHTDGGMPPGDPVSRAMARGARRWAGALLIGGPGQGKSTLGQLACQVHRVALLRVQGNMLSPAARQVIELFDAEDGTDIPSPRAPLFPLRIVLPEAAGWLAQSSGAAMAKEQPIPVLLRFLGDQPSGRKARLDVGALCALIGRLPSLLVLDGFDEVGAAEDRERLVSAARELLVYLGERDARALVLATTRPQGYAGELARTGVPLRTLYLTQLGTGHALGYAKKLVMAKIPGADDQEKALSRLRAAAQDPPTSRLMQTPLQVTILAALVQQMGRVPSERWKLFSSYFDITYRREVERNTFASELLAKYRTHIEAIHRRVALILQVEAESAGGAAARMPRARIQEIVDSVLREDEFKDEDRADLAQRIVDAAEQRLVFLVEPEPGSFGFEIRSLQEFMAAWALTVDGRDSPDGRDPPIEARLLQIAKVPLFRNVVLFMASKLFSERLALRDVLAERVCGVLDEDPADALARATKAGALLGPVSLLACSSFACYRGDGDARRLGAGRPCGDLAARRLLEFCC
jgi:hypothetical protein